MKYERVCLSSALVLLATAACGGTEDSSGASTSTDTTTMTNDQTAGGTAATAGTAGGSSTSAISGTGANCPAAASTIMASEANNYRFSSTLSFPSTVVAPDTELTFDWSGLTQDFLGHGMEVRSEVDTVNLMLWNLTAEELEIKLNADDLASRDLAVIATLYTENDATSGTLFQFTSVGMVLPPEEILPFVDATGYDPATHTYTIMAATGEELGQGTRMIQAFKLDPNSTNTSVVLTDESTALDYTVDLHSLSKTQIPMADANYTFDWSNMTTNALGNEFLLTNITEIMVARFNETPAELEAKFIDLVDYSGAVVAAADLYTGNVPAGTSATLSTLMNESGEFFPGIDANGTWVVGLFCGSCQNPAPWYMSVLEACQ